MNNAEFKDMLVGFSRSMHIPAKCCSILPGWKLAIIAGQIWACKGANEEIIKFAPPKSAVTEALKAMIEIMFLSSVVLGYNRATVHDISLSTAKINSRINADGRRVSCSN